LWQLADLVQADERRRSFRARAYRRAVWALDELDPDLRVDRDVMLATPGIGSGVASLIEEYGRTGVIHQLDRLRGLYPDDTASLRRLPRMTPTLLRSLKADLGVDSVADLLRAIDTEDALTLKGVGEATVQLWQAILQLPPRPGMVPAFRAWVTASELIAHLRRHITGGAAHIAGAVRRVEEWVDRIDIVLVPGVSSAIDDFLVTSAVLRRADRSADGLAFETHAGIRGRLHFSRAESLGTTMVEATGPPAHVAEILGTDSHVPYASEEEAYQSRELPWIPPPSRRLPLDQAVETVRMGDVRGDLHVHSDRSPDGRMPLDLIVEMSIQRGYRYLLITDHTLGLRFGGLGRDELLMQADELEHLRSRYPELTILHGAEVNIGLDGTLDIDDETLAMLDMVVAGLHSHFGLPIEQQTARVIEALGHPAVRVLAHPTGRRIGTRPPIELDVPAVIAAAVSHDRALECNGHRDRLDLSVPWVQLAAGMGARFAANSDAHRPDELGNIANAVAILQAAGVGSAQVVNTAPVDEFARWLAP
jgi:DNA polymerase (family 10)